mmetsp:Transcript_3786/g.4357  ORF Transcript_3786/g.4357 Transcript_3786/m.4357 type:complete len:87 (-) Transcript_3786:103-363(-)
MVFTRGISGSRVVSKRMSKTVAGTSFEGYGASYSNYHSHYITAACSIGITKEEIDILATRLEKCFAEAYSKILNKAVPANCEVRKK